MKSLKRKAARHAADKVPSGAVVGLGSGSTAALAIEALGTRDIEIRGVPTSFQARRAAIGAGIELVELDEVDGIDIAIDGADQVTQDNVLIKGGGGAHTREKIIDATAEQLLIVVDHSKVAEQPNHPVPVEVLPAAHPVVTDRIRELGGTPSLRTAESKSGPTITDNGNFIIDAAFGAIDDAATLDRSLAEIPGVVDHGLFVNMADEVIIGTDDGTDRLLPEP